MFLSAVGFDDEGAPIGVPQRGLEGFGEALLGVGAHAKPIDHHVHRVLHVLRQARRGVELVHFSVDAHAREALRAQLVEQLGLLAFTPRDHRREDHELRVLGQREHLVHHLRHGLRLQRQVVLRAVRRADARVQQPQIVVDLGHGADGGARVMARRLLLDGDGGRQALDQVDVGLFHQLQELARVRRQRLDVAPLPFRVQRVEGERALARAREAGDDHEPVARQLEAEILQIVRARSADADAVHRGNRKVNLLL